MLIIKRHLKIKGFYGITCLFVLLNISLFSTSALSQADGIEKATTIQYPDTLNKSRLYAVSAVVGTGYIASSIGLYNTWYKQFPRSGFHFFNDWGEWSNMDKIGHSYTAYFQGVTGYKLARWTGLKENQAIMIGAFGGMLFQTTIELMDGFSEEWGFSWTDMGANILGTGLFAFQQKHWGEQKFQLKFSSWPSTPPNQLILGSLGNMQSLEMRAEALFGDGFLERFLKDYNGQSYWLSFNLNEFSQQDFMPNWFNIALGYSVENLYGGFENIWENDGEIYNVEVDLPRYHQFMLGLDLNLEQIRTKSPFVNTLLSLLNAYKLPMPALEYNTLGEWRFHLVFKN